MKYRASIIALAVALSCPASAQMTRTGLQGYNNTNVKVNGTGAITGSVMNIDINNLITSMGVLSDSNTWTGSNYFSSQLAIANPLTFRVSGSDVGSVMHVANVTALKAIPYVDGVVTRDGYALPGDGVATDYKHSAIACSLNAGAGDNGVQVLASDGGCWNAVIPVAGVDVRVWGADASGVTDSSAAITAAAASGVNLRFVPGTYKFASMTLAGSQTVSCDSVFNTVLAQNSTSGDFITMSGYYNHLSHCNLTPSVRTTGYQVVFEHSCYSCGITDFWFSHGYNQINVKAGNRTTIRDGIIGSMIGKIGIRFAGESGAKANNLIMHNVFENNAYPLGYGNVVDWLPSTSYATGDVSKINNAIYQQSASTCVSASSGSGPSGFPDGTTPQSVFSGVITDGTCTWRFVSNGLIGYVQDSWAYSSSLTNFTVLNNLEAIKLTDTASTIQSEPSYNRFNNISGDHNFWATLDIQAGFDNEFVGTYACSSLALNGAQFGGLHRGGARIIGGRFCDNWQNGIYVAAGDQVTITGANVGSNSQAGSGLFHNIVVAPDISQFSITNNMVGKDLQAGPAHGSQASYGVLVQSGASDYYTVTGNICAGEVVTACTYDGGSGTNKTFSGNW